MKQKHHRMLCAFCALVILVSTVFPTAAFAEQPVDAAAAEQTLTRADAAEMQQADAAVTALTESEQYQEPTPGKTRRWPSWTRWRPRAL